MIPTPIYDSVCRDLGYRPVPTRITFHAAAEGGSPMKIEGTTSRGNKIAWYIPHSYLVDTFDPSKAVIISGL